MSNTTTTTNNINGLVFFNEGNAAGAIIRLGEKDGEARMRGSWDDDHVVLDNGRGDSLHLKRLTAASEKHPIARGMITLGDVTTPVVGFLNSLEDGTKVIGLREDTVAAKLVSCPW